MKAYNKLGIKAVVGMDDVNLKKDKAGIYNLEPTGSGGSHWVSYWVKDSDVYHFDMLGYPPDLPFVKSAKTNKLHITWNKRQYQTSASDLCGYYALFMLDHFNKGKSDAALTNQFSVTDRESNDELIRTWWRSL